MALKNAGIASANPNAIANKNYINALYRERYNRDATQAELNQFANRTVKDAANIILGQSLSPFANTTTINPTPSPSPTPAPTTNQPSTTKTSTNTLKAYDQQGNVVYVKPGEYYPGISATPPSTPSPAPDTNKAKEPSENQPSPADVKWINDLYQKYFDRTATSAEINNWSKSTPDALSQFLQGEQTKLGYVSKEMGADRKKRYDEAMAIINNSDLPEDIKALWRNTVGLYPDATDFKPQEIIDTFNKIKKETVDPYFKELADVAINDLRTSFTSLQDDRARELEAERANAGESIRQAKAGLEKSGMTFSGKGIEDLGASSAYAQPGSTVVAEGTPTQTPFAGLNNVFYEGKVNQGNRLLASSSAARYAQAQQNLGRTAESLLGTNTIMNAIPGFSYTPTGVNLTGKLATDKQAKYGATLNDIIANWRSSQQLKKNI